MREYKLYQYQSIIYHLEKSSSGKLSWLHINQIVKITNLLVSTVARNSGNCNLISHVGCYDRMVTYM